MMIFKPLCVVLALLLISVVGRPNGGHHHQSQDGEHTGYHQGQDWGHNEQHQGQEHHQGEDWDHTEQHQGQEHHQGEDWDHHRPSSEHNNQYMTNVQSGIFNKPEPTTIVPETTVTTASSMTENQVNMFENINPIPEPITSIPMTESSTFKPQNFDVEPNFETELVSDTIVMNPNSEVRSLQSSPEPTSVPEMVAVQNGLPIESQVEIPGVMRDGRTLGVFLFPQVRVVPSPPLTYVPVTSWNTPVVVHQKVAPLGFNAQVYTFRR